MVTRGMTLVAKVTLKIGKTRIPAGTVGRVETVTPESVKLICNGGVGEVLLTPEQTNLFEHRPLLSDTYQNGKRVSWAKSTFSGDPEAVCVVPDTVLG